MLDILKKREKKDFWGRERVRRDKKGSIPQFLGVKTQVLSRKDLRVVSTQCMRPEATTQVEH